MTAFSAGDHCTTSCFAVSTIFRCLLSLPAASRGIIAGWSLAELFLSLRQHLTWRSSGRPAPTVVGPMHGFVLSSAGDPQRLISKVSL